MKRHEILQNLFGYLSEEEALSSHEMNHQPESNSDGGPDLDNETISSQEVEIDSGFQLNEDAISSRSCDIGAEHEKQSITETGIQIESGPELNDEARSSWYSDRVATSENKSICRERVKIEGGVELNDEGAGLNNEAKSSRLIQSERDKDQVRISAVIRAVFGDSDDDEPAEVEYGTDQGENYSISPEHKAKYKKDLESEDIVSYVDTGYVTEEEKAEDKLEGQSICGMLVLEIPQRTPLADPSQMATAELPNIIGFDYKPFDPTTYVEEDFYITDASGSERLIPSTNIIQWRNVKNWDGTTSVECNARLVTWSDGSLQLFIGNEAFDVTEEDRKEILAHAFLWNEAIYQSLVRISKSAKVASSSLVSDSNSLTALDDQGTTHAVPETMAEQQEQADLQTADDNLLLNEENNDKKVTSIHNIYEYNEHLIWLSDVEDANYEGPKDS